MVLKYPIICSHIYCYSNISLTPSVAEQPLAWIPNLSTLDVLGLLYMKINGRDHENENLRGCLHHGPQSCPKWNALFHGWIYEKCDFDSPSLGVTSMWIKKCDLAPKSGRDNFFNCMPEKGILGFFLHAFPPSLLATIVFEGKK